MPQRVSAEVTQLPSGVPTATRWRHGAMKRRAAAGGAPGGHGTVRGDGWRRTAADDQLLSGATRLGVLTSRQAARRYWGGVEGTARNRIAMLRQAGYIQTSTFQWGGAYLWATARGARAAEGDLRALTGPPGGRLLHQLAVADAVITFELGRARVLTEREVRRAEATSASRAEQVAASLTTQVGSVTDGRSRERFLCAPVGAHGRVHYPDLVVASPAGLVAVEVEITPKKPAELRQVLRAYSDARRLFGQVIYLATEPVMALIHGHAHPRTGEWTEGVAQQVGLLPPGPPRYGPDSPFLVRHFQPKDVGVAYQLDLRQVPDTWWLDFPQWKRLRARWEVEGDGVGWLAWWQQQRRP